MTVLLFIIIFYLQYPNEKITRLIKIQIKINLYLRYIFYNNGSDSYNCNCNLKFQMYIIIPIIHNFFNFSLIGLYLPSFHRQSMHFYCDTNWTNAPLSFICTSLVNFVCFFVLFSMSFSIVTFLKKLNGL